jgi:uncharacterized protein with FMN-binding domain
MTAARWRGTLVYTGAVAAIGTVALARFGPLVAAAPTAAETGTSTSAAGTATGTSAGTGTATDPGAAASPTDTATPAAGSDTSSSVTVVGSVAQTRYGPVQVQVTFTGAQIVDVQTLQSPSSHRESAQISARATPVLADEVVAAQSAQIDTVSGATYTSAGYRESVQSAIDQVG